MNRVYIAVVQGVAEVAYQAEFRSRWNTDVIGELKAAEAAGPQHVEQFFEKLANVPISHDVHFDLEESNSKSTSLASWLTTIIYKSTNTSCRA